MPLLTDAKAVRAILETDRAWSAYALGDLDPAQLPFCEWRTGAADGTALLLLYRRFDTPVLFTLGAPDVVDRLLDEVAHERRLYLSIRPDIMPRVKKRYTVRREAPMWRMVLASDRGSSTGFEPDDPLPAVRLGPEAVPALQALYADGEAADEGPDFFFPEMVDRGAFYGIYDRDTLVAAAGTHLVAPSESVAAVGNVYTRRDCRGRGLALRVTGAVTAELRRSGIRTIALNVAQRNAAAVALYERLGFTRYCPFYEGVAEAVSGR
jgi:ribosomal protein S18 acetylase RimI-like enzyme